MNAVLDVETAPAAAAQGRVRGFFGGAREIDDAPLVVRGRLPDWLRGTLLLDTPAVWELPHGALRHWFDGYAMWHALRLGDGAPRYRSRFAASESFRRSVERGRPVTGEFGSPNPSGLIARLRTPPVTDNPVVVMSRVGDRWFGVSETPTLTFFDPHTLATEERLVLSRPDDAVHLMSAHGFTLEDGSYLNVGTELGGTCTMKLLHLRPGQTRPDVLARLRMPKLGYTHAFALAPGHAIVWECALRLDAVALRFSKRSYAECFAWKPRGGSAVHAVSLDDGAVATWRIPPMMAFHATQAYGDGADLVLEIAVYDDGSVFGDLMLDRRRADLPLRARLRHVRYRLRRGRADAEPEPMPGPAIELQQVHPARIGQARARVAWGTGLGEGGRFADRTLRVDLDSGAATEYRRPDAVHLEPLFVPRPGGQADDDGVLLVPTLAAADDDGVVAVVDAHTMKAVAELVAPQVLPFGFHAAFVPARPGH
jgi:carotenoid cleavage dioxygenase-like enzyme